MIQATPDHGSETGAATGAPALAADSRIRSLFSRCQPSFFRRYFTALLDLVYPRRCEICEQPLEPNRAGAGQWLCQECLDRLPRIEPPFCKVCGEPFEGAMTDVFQCGNCAELTLHFEFAVSPCRARDAVRLMIHRFKYQRRLDLRGALSSLLAEVFEDPRLAALDRTSWTLVPVPLHPARERERQYNQAWELCRELSARSEFPARKAMRRVRPTTAQASLTRHQRIENLRGAFAMDGSVLRGDLLRGANVLLVDDVLTTGSTTSECARVLRREGGVEKVVVITVARG
jgi:competence protein ComFC